MGYGGQLSHRESWRRGPELNRRIELLQSSALPLGYRALNRAGTLPEFTRGWQELKSGFLDPSLSIRFAPRRCAATPGPGQKSGRLERCAVARNSARSPFGAGPFTLPASGVAATAGRGAPAHPGRPPPRRGSCRSRRQPPRSPGRTARPSGRRAGRRSRSRSR